MATAALHILIDGLTAELSPNGGIAGVRSTVSILAGPRPLPGLEGIEGPVDTTLDELFALEEALAEDGGTYVFESRDGTGRGVRFTRDEDLIRVSDVPSRWARPHAELSLDVVVSFASLEDVLVSLEDALRSALREVAPAEADAWCDARFAREEEEEQEEEEEEEEEEKEAPAPMPSAATAARPVPAATAVVREVLAKRSPDMPPPRAEGPRKAPVPAAAGRTKGMLLFLAIVLGACMLTCVGAGFAGKSFMDRVSLGYTPSGLRAEVRDGVRVLVHPHLGFAIRHPGDDMVRSPEIERDAATAGGGSSRGVEFIAYADAGRELVLLVATEVIPVPAGDPLSAAAADVRREISNARIVMEGTRNRNGTPTFELLFEENDVYTLISLRVLRDASGKHFAVLLSASGGFPEGLLPVIDSFAPRGATLGRPRRLHDARAQHATALDPVSATATPDPALVPPPPSSGFELVSYRSGDARLAAYRSLEPTDGGTHPALVFLHGGFEGVGEDCFDLLASYRRAGFVILCPTYRGEAGNPGRHELFHGELDDARAALAHVRALPYVDGSKIYVLGHSAGGTLALLLAASTDGIRSAISVGGSPDVNDFTTSLGDDLSLVPYDAGQYAEGYVRSALPFMGDLRTPTFYVEGENGAIVAPSLAAMKRIASASPHSFVGAIVPGRDHFDVLEPALALFLPALLSDARDGSGVTVSESALLGLAPAEPAP